MPDPGNISPIIETPADPRFGGKGSFVVGTEAVFFFYFVDIDGRMYDPSDLGISITDSDGTEIKTSDGLDWLELGKFAFKWSIPSTTTPGKHVITVSYTAETVDGPSEESFAENFVLVELGPGNFSIRQIGARSFLESLIGYTQRIPVFNEIVRFNKAKTQGRISFDKLNQTAGVNVYLNGQVKETGYTMDYFRGKIVFSHSLSQWDEITLDYNFRWFSDTELDNFLEQGVNILNAYPPMSAYTIFNVPDRWVIVAEYAAAVDVIRRWMMDLAFQEPAKIFGFNRAKDIFSQMDTLKKNYEERLDKLLNMKKFGPYLGLTKTVSTPEFTLPGGRSRWFRYLFKGA